MKLKEFETILKENDVRPCDFWDNIDQNKWDDVLYLIHTANNIKQLKKLFEMYY